MDYLVCIKYFKEDSIIINKRIDFSVNVEYLEKLEDKYTIRVKKHGLLINRRVPDLIIEQIAENINKALYPIEISIDFNGRFKEVENIDSIKSRWASNKEEMMKQYKGEMIKSIIKKIDYLLNNPFKFEISLEQDMFWSIFFIPNYLAYGENLKIKRNVSFPIDSYSVPISHIGESKINSFLSPQNTIEINFKGVAKIPKTSKRYYKLHKDVELESTLEINCDLDDKYHIPLWMKSVCSINRKDDNKKMESVEVSIYKE